MPYVITFVRPVAISEPDQYINDCCMGGDLVLDQLLPGLRELDPRAQPVQEDWGWFSWFELAGVKLAVDVHTHDVETGEFEVHLTSRTPKRFFGDKVQDTTELDALRDIVVARLHAWSASGLQVQQVDEKYNPVG